IKCVNMLNSFRKLSGIMLENKLPETCQTDCLEHIMLRVCLWILRIYLTGRSDYATWVRQLHISKWLAIPFWQPYKRTEGILSINRRIIQYNSEVVTGSLSKLKIRPF